MRATSSVGCVEPGVGWDAAISQQRPILSDNDRRRGWATVCYHLRTVLAIATTAASVFTFALTPQRAWLDDLAMIVPAAGMTRWMLLLDAVCLVLLGSQQRRPHFGIPIVLGGGFIALNVLGMAVTEFFLGLALFHIAVTVTAVLALRRRRWFGVLALAAVLAAGILT